jgi:hypothetical protein
LALPVRRLLRLLVVSRAVQTLVLPLTCANSETPLTTTLRYLLFPILPWLMALPMLFSLISLFNSLCPSFPLLRPVFSPSYSFFFAQLRTAAAPSASPAAAPAAAPAKATPLDAGRVASTGQSSLQLFMFGYDSTNASSNQVNDYLSTSSVAPVEGSRATKSPWLCPSDVCFGSSWYLELSRRRCFHQYGFDPERRLNESFGA